MRWASQRTPCASMNDAAGCPGRVGGTTTPRYGPADVEHLRLIVDLRRLDLRSRMPPGSLAGITRTLGVDRRAARMIEARRAEIADRIAGLHALDAKLAGLQGHLGRPRRWLAVIDGPCCDAADAVIGAAEGGCACCSTIPAVELVAPPAACRSVRTEHRVEPMTRRQVRRKRSSSDGTGRSRTPRASASLRDTDRDAAVPRRHCNSLGLKQPLTSSQRWTAKRCQAPGTPLARACRDHRSPVPTRRRGP